MTGRRWEDRHEPFVTWSRYGLHVRCSCGEVWRGDAAQLAWAVHVGREMQLQESAAGMDHTTKGPVPWSALRRGEFAFLDGESFIPEPLVPFTGEVEAW